MGNIKILLVEDNEDDGFLIQHKLMKYEADNLNIHFLLSIVRNRLQLDSALESKDWNVVVSDYVLPDMPWPTVLQLLRRTVPDPIPLIIISGVIDERTGAVIVNDGATDFVIKSFMDRLGGMIVNAHEHFLVSRQMIDTHKRAQDLLSEETAKVDDIRTRLGLGRDE